MSAADARSATAQAPPGPGLLVGLTVIRKDFPPISRHALALYCGASGDYNPIHVDIDFARGAGFDDVFAQGMLVMAYLGQALTDAVPPGSVRSFTTRFSAITPLGARITCEARVTEVLDGFAKLALTAVDEFGAIKLQGEATVTLDGWESRIVQA